MSSPGFGARARSLRKKLGLNPIQAALALNIKAPSRIEDMERTGVSPWTFEALESAYSAFLHAGPTSRGRNLLFGQLPISVARSLLRLSVEEIAERCGYSVSFWMRMEADHRPLRADVLKRLEADVKEEVRRTILKC
jgi:hypothetical protein